MYDKMLLLRQRMSNGIISLLGIFLAEGVGIQTTVGAGLPAIAVARLHDLQLTVSDAGPGCRVELVGRL